MITAQVSPACYANVTYMTEMTPRMGNRKFICGLNQLQSNYQCSWGIVGVTAVVFHDISYKCFHQKMNSLVHKNTCT